ncbi:MAG: O-antigen ligase family protein [Sulfurimonas sp.]
MTLSNIKTLDYNKIINYLLIGYAFSLPLSKASTNIFETLILLTWLLQGDWKSKYQLYKKNLLIIGFVALMIAYTISIPWAIDTEFALRYIAKFRHFLIILAIYSSLDKDFVKRILSAFLIGMFLSEIMSYGIYFELWHYKNILPTDPSPFMSHVDYSVYLAFTSVLLLSRIIDNTENNIKIKIGYALFFISATSNLFINGGRTGQVTLIILIYISVLLSFKHKLKALVTSTLLITTIFTLAYNFSPNFKQRLIQGSEGISNMIYKNNYTSDGFNQRVSLWIVGIDNFQDHFFIGNGLGNDTKEIKYYAQKRGFDPEFLSKFGDNHNMFLIVALQIGIIGLFIMIFIFYAIFTLKFNSNMHKILNLTFIVGFFLWSMGNTTFHTMNPMIFFALFAGLFNKISAIESANIKIKV